MKIMNKIYLKYMKYTNNVQYVEISNVKNKL